MLDTLEDIYQESLAELQNATTSDELEAWHRATLGRKGSVQLQTRRIGQLPPEERPQFGRRVNEIKEALEEAYEDQAARLRAKELEAKMAAEAIDVTLPGRKPWRGRLHPATQTLRQIYRIWGDMGFQIYRSRDVETDEYNFELLNIPQHHPRHVGHLPHHRAGRHLAHAYQSRTDPRHARIPSRTHSRHPARHVLSLRATNSA